MPKRRLQTGTNGGCIMRALWGLLLALLLTGCMTGGSNTPSAGNWAISRYTDSISGAPVGRASLSAFAVSGDGQHLGLARIHLLCFDTRPVDSGRVEADFRV